MTGKVLLVHGLLNATSWLRPLAARLRAHGFAPELFGYSSLLDGPQRAVPRLVERLRLAAHVGEIGLRRGAAGNGFGARQRLARIQRGAHFQQGARGADLHLRGQRRLAAVGRRHQQPAPGTAAGQRCGEHAIDRTDLPGQRQFAEEFPAIQRLARDLAAGGEDAQGDRQVEAAAVLGQVGRGQVDGDPARRELELRAVDGGAYPVLGFADRRFRQSDDAHRRQATAEVDLDPDFGRVHAHPRTAVHDRKAHGGGRQCCGGLCAGAPGASPDSLARSRSSASSFSRVRATTAAWQAQLRGRDPLGRVGGEEFVVVCPDTSLEQALVVANRLREAANLLRFDDIDPALRVSVSIGAAQSRKAEESCDALLDRADAALYRAKQQGRDRVES